MNMKDLSEEKARYVDFIERLRKIIQTTEEYANHFEKLNAKLKGKEREKKLKRILGL